MMKKDLIIQKTAPCKAGKRVLSAIMALAMLCTMMCGITVPVTATSYELLNPITGTVQGAGYDETAGHYGIDLYPYNYGDPVYAVASGTIMYSCPRNHTKEYQSGDDCCTVKIILDEPITYNGTTYVCAFYTHMSALVYDIYCGYKAACVEEYNAGLRTDALPTESVHVEAGDLIGYVGKGNGATHLHFSFEASEADGYAMMPNSEYYDVFEWCYNDSITAGGTTSVSNNVASAYSTGMTLTQLQAKFPEGKYWNGGNADGYTSYACTCHGQGICIAGTSPCTCNHFQGGTQCNGFARKLAYDAYGSHLSTWQTTSSSSYVDSLKPGDVVYNDSPHWFMVISVSSDSVTVGECNWGSRCVIKWSRTVKKSTIKGYDGLNIFIAPYSLTSGSSTSVHTHTYSITEYEAAHPHKAYIKCSCGEFGGYTGATKYVSSCSSCSDTCTCSSSYAGTYTCITTNYPLTIRSGHGTSYDAIGSIPSGASVTVTRANGSWAHVTYNGVSGYASMEYLAKPYSTSSAYPVPFKCYTLSDDNHAADAFDAPNGNHIGYIYGTDYCTVKEIYSNGWCLVNVPWDSGTKDVYTYTGNFFNTSFTPVIDVVESSGNTYIRYNTSTRLGNVDAGDKVTIVDRYGVQVQAIYPHTDGTYRCAWINAYHFDHTHTPGAAATCTSPQVCTTCDAIIAGVTSHTPGAAATCTSNQTCTVCGVILNTQTAHTPGAAATCTTVQKCTVCGIILAGTIEHSYTAGDYTDPTHPHTIYNTCDCGAMSDSGYYAKVLSCTECYPTPTISGITYSPSTVKVGDTVTFTLNATGGTEHCICIGDGTDEIFKSLTSSCTYQFTKAGTYYIYGWVRNASGTKYPDTVTLVVEDNIVSVNSVSLNKTSATIDVGDTLNLTATVAPSNATNKNITWNSSNTSIASVSNGVVTAKSAGTTTITATTVDASKTATCIVIVSAPEEPINPNAAAIVVNDITTRAGETFDVTVDVANNPGMCFLQVTLEYDESVLTLKGASNGSVLSTFENGVNLQWSADADTSKNGTLVTLTFEVNEDAEAGEYTVNTIFREAYDSDLNDVVFTVAAGTITVADFIYGDANGDGEVTGKDAVLLRKYMVNYNYDTGTSSVAVSPGADANGDGEVTGKDAVLLRKYMVNYNYDTGTSSVVLGPQQ